MAGGVVFRVLGTMEVLVDGSPVGLGRRRERGLLAVLVLEAGKVVPVDRLIDLLWDGIPTANARQNLHSHVSRLRGQISGAGAWILARDGGYVADLDPMTVDAHQFRVLVEAGRRHSDPRERSRLLQQGLALWRGPVLADLTPDRLRERVAGDLEEMRLAATETAFEAELALGRHSDLIGELSMAVAEHPLRERLAGQLMLALYRAGRHSEASAVYHRLRVRLAEESGLDPGPELQQRHLAVVRQDAELLADPVAQVRVLPSQLPLATSYFTGREMVLAELDGTAVVVIRGMAGVGKTALAVHWAHRAAGRFPDGQLFADLGGYSAGRPLPARKVLAHFLMSLGVAPERLPAGELELAALYRSSLAGRKVLVLLDNAASADQVRPLIPGTLSCTTVVTSRADLAGLVATRDARPITLDVLDEADATRLLSEILGPAKAAGRCTQIRDLARLCGFLPLALRIAAAQILTSGVSAAELVRALSRGDRLDVLGIPSDPQVAVRVALDLSIQALDFAARHLFCLLALVPGRDFTVPVAASLVGVASHHAENVLRVLVGAHLVQSGEDGRYRMHDLVREYAGERATLEMSEQARRAAVVRAAGWYLYTACNADAALTPFRARPGVGRVKPPSCPPLQFSSHADALAWCVAEEANLVAVIDQAAERDLHEIAWRTPASLGYFSWVHKGHIDLVECFRIGQASALRHDDREAAAWMSFGMGIALEQRGEFEAAIAEYQDAVLGYQDVDLPWAAGCALTNIGNSQRDLGRFGEAFEYYRRSAEVFEQCGMRWGIGLNLYAEANAYRLMGRPDEALARYRSSAGISSELGFHWGVGVNLVCIGDVHRSQGNPEEAISCYRSALTAARDSGDRTGEGDVLDLCAQAARDLGRTAEAAKYWENALEIFDESDRSRAGEIRVRLTALRAQL